MNLSTLVASADFSFFWLPLQTELIQIRIQTVCRSDSVPERLFFEKKRVNLEKILQITIPLKSGHYRPACQMPFKWRFAGPTLNAGLVACDFSEDPDQYR